MMKKKNSCTWTIISINYDKLQKKLFQNSFKSKSCFWQKGHVILFYNNPAGSLYLICTHLSILWQRMVSFQVFNLLKELVKEFLIVDAEKNKVIIFFFNWNLGILECI
jgi:hypothetical protein